MPKSLYQNAQELRVSPRYKEILVYSTGRYMNWAPCMHVVMGLDDNNCDQMFYPLISLASVALGKAGHGQ